MTLDELKLQYDVNEHIEERIETITKPQSGIVLITGSSGSGKTTILKNWGYSSTPSFSNEVSVIENFSSLTVGEELLRAFGLKSIPTWFRPFNTLSNGEKHRAECALSLDKGLVFIDEFTSTVDRDTAKSLSVTLKKHFKKGSLLILASCHRDIIEWLIPDHVYDADSKEWMNRGLLRRPSIEVTIMSSTIKDWVYFKKHHYLSSDLSKSCHFYTGYYNNKPIAFLAVIHRCGRDIKSYWGESRLVVIPEFQGMGIGPAFSEAVGEEYTKRGLRYFSKTAHPSLGNYRNNSPKWRATSTNMVKRTSYVKDGQARKQTGFGKKESEILRDFHRICYSHEFIG